MCRNRYTVSFFSLFLLLVFWKSFSREQAAWPFSSSLWSHPEHFSLGTRPSCAPACAALHRHIALQPKQARLVLMWVWFSVPEVISQNMTHWGSGYQPILKPRIPLSSFCGIALSSSVLLYSRVTCGSFHSKTYGLMSWRVKAVK